MTVAARGHSYNEARSLWLHRAIAAKLAADPERVLAKARSNLAHMAAVHGACVATYVQRWRALLDGPRETLLQAMTAEGTEAADLRQCTPFAGVLTPQERWDAYRAFACAAAASRDGL